MADFQPLSAAEEIFRNSTNEDNTSCWCSIRWSQWPGLNRRPTVYETVALPLSYIGANRAYNKSTPARFVKVNVHRVLARCSVLLPFGDSVIKNQVKDEATVWLRLCRARFCRGCTFS